MAQRPITRPGFDSFGMAFRYYDEVEVRPVTGPTRVEIEGVGADSVPTDDDNLVVRALRDGLEAVGAPQAGFEMRYRIALFTLPGPQLYEDSTKCQSLKVAYMSLK